MTDLSYRYTFAAGVALLIIGTGTTWRASRRAELRGAFIPDLFGLRQLMEGV